MRTRKPVPVHNLKVTRKGKVKKRNLLWRMRRALFLAVLAGVVLASGLAYVLTSIDLPVDPRAATSQKQTSFICAADVVVDCNQANSMAQLHGTEDRVIIGWDEIPPVLREATVSAEDRDFFKHGGVDPAGIARALYHDVRGNSQSRQGGSTITQQYVKQEYLSTEQTFTRKIKEAVMAIKLEQKISKQEILTRYLNTVYFGRGAYGVQAASRTWFGHDVQNLNAGEAAFLAGLLRNPNSADPYRGAKSLKEAIRRRKVVLTAMAQEGYLTDDERDRFEEVPMDPNAPGIAEADRMIKPPPTASTLGQNVKGAEYGSKYFAEYVRQWLVKKYGADTVLGGGLKVYTTLDLRLQKEAYDTVTQTLDEDGDPQASIVSIDNQGRVVAMMAGENYDISQVNLVTGTGGSGRQAGSTFKMFALADAMRRGYSVQSVVKAPGQIEITNAECRDTDGSSWKVSGPTTGNANLAVVTRGSVNTAFAQIMVKLGPKHVAQTAIDMGVTSLKGKRPLCSWVLGSAEVTPLEMAAGYTTIMNQGVAKTPIVVTKVEFPDGRVDTFVPEQKQVLTVDQAARVRYALEAVVRNGTGRSANFGKPVAGKTGTTQSNVDAWFIGFTPTLTTAVWMGYAKGQVEMSNVHGIEVQGGTFPAEMFRDYMTEATAGTETQYFPEIPTSVIRGGETLFPALGKSDYVGGSTPVNENNGGGGSTTSTSKPKSGN
jgi:penicillin-binding protein 1A